MEKKKYIVAGAGFRGFCDALELSKIANTEVTIIESAPFFGGLMYSLDIDGFAVDKGVHMFDSIPKDLAKIVDEIMEGQVEEVKFVSASAFNEKLTEGFSLPDLNSLGDVETKEKIKSELIAISERNEDKGKGKNLHEFFQIRYGETAGAIFSNIFKKVYGLEATAVEPNAIAQTSMGRLKFLDDPEMLELKNLSKRLDDVLAARRKSVGKVDDYVSIYPTDGRAMRGWCERAEEWLRGKGINILLSEKILSIDTSEPTLQVTTDKRTLQADKVFWSNDNTKALGNALDIDTTSLEELRYGTPMLFITMFTQKDKIKDFTYLQNFDPSSITYRTASAGIFSKQERENISFITSECPVEINGDRWNNPEESIQEAWNEVKHLGIVDSDATLTGSNLLKLPSTFRLAKVGYSEKVAELNDKLKSKTSQVIFRNVVPFFRRDIYFDSLKIKELL